MLEHLTEENKKKGTFDDGISDINGESMVLKEKTTVFTDKHTNSEVIHYHYEINTGISWEDITELRKKNTKGKYYLIIL